MEKVQKEITEVERIERIKYKIEETKIELEQTRQEADEEKKKERLGAKSSMLIPRLK